ncbi:SDR family oxidoreductase [Actinocrispum sp. NPDC049592]|uniref:SDR family oxidoreductase n=1 Tax=Actinocrispum sp. NPDC049592 TaxID=3154835 RepID=UPI00342BBFA0
MTNYENLAGRTAVVTGAASGIGAATARVLASNGARVALLARRLDRITELAEKINADGGQAIAVAADVTSDSSIAAAVSAVHAAFGRVDLLVNNAGVMLPRPVTEGNFAEWQRMVDTNFLGLLRVTQAFNDDLTADGPADLVNISSVGAHMTFPEYDVYVATKAAVTHLSNNLRATYGPLGVRVTNIEPGMVATELVDHVREEGKAFLDEYVASMQPMSADELADIVAYTTSRPPNVNLRQIMALPTSQY